MLSFHAIITCCPLLSFPCFTPHHLTFPPSPPLFLSHSCLSPRPLHISPLFPLPSFSVSLSLSPGEHPFKAFAPGLFQELRANEGEREAHRPALRVLYCPVTYHICTAPCYAMLCCPVHACIPLCVCVCVCVDVTAAAPLVRHHSPAGTLDLLRFLPFLSSD
jgi:hypothetical protein